MKRRQIALGEDLAQKLGWFSIGLGAAELLAPRWVAQLIGAGEDGGRHPLLRAYGVREIAAGVGILGQRRPGPWVWARVLGDALDLTSLGFAFFANGSNPLRLTLSSIAIAGVTAADLVCLNHLDEQLTATLATKLVSGEVHPVTKTITIGKTPEELYGFWRDFSRLPQIMSYLEAVEVTSQTHSHWRAKGPIGSRPEWDAEITEDVPNQKIAWRSVGGEIAHSGAVEFRPATGNRGTVVSVTLNYQPPGGALGVRVAKLFGSEPGQEIAASLRAFKQVMETGEITRSDASIHSGMHPAVPPADTSPMNG